MTHSHKILTLLALGMIALFSIQGSAQANDLIGVRAQGYVNGNITQRATHGGQTTVYVGSVVSNNRPGRIRNVDVNAVYDGDIYIESRSNAVTLSVGSYIKR